MTLIQSNIHLAGSAGVRATRSELLRILEGLGSGELAAAGGILDVGCGSGWLLRALSGDLAPNRLHGVDVDGAAVEVARRTVPGARIVQADARRLPWRDGRFSMVVVASILSRLPAEDASAVLAEAYRVTERGGLLVVYDARPALLGLRRVRLVAPQRVAQGLAEPAVHRTLTLPRAIAAGLGPLARIGYRPLVAVPALRTHAITAIRKGSDEPPRLPRARPVQPVARPSGGLSVRRSSRAIAQASARAASRIVRDGARALRRPHLPLWSRRLRATPGARPVHVWMLVRNDCTTDNRVLRQAEALAATGSVVTIIAVRRGPVQHDEFRNGFEIARVAIDPWHYRVLRWYRHLPKSARARARAARWWRPRVRRLRRLLAVATASLPHGRSRGAARHVRRLLAKARALHRRLPASPALFPATGRAVPPAPIPRALGAPRRRARALASRAERQTMEAWLGRSDGSSSARRAYLFYSPVATLCALLLTPWRLAWWLAGFAARLVVVVAAFPLHPWQTTRRAASASRPVVYRWLHRNLLRAHRPLLTYDYLTRVTAVVNDRLAGLDTVDAPAAHVVHANDLNTLAAGVALARWLGARLVYDSHELQFGTVRANGFSPSRRAVMRGWERLLVARADAVMTVNDSVSIIMARALRIQPPVVVRNCPAFRSEPPVPNPAVRRNLGLDDTARIAIYHGNMAEFRGLEELVDAAPQLPPDVVVVMLGGGSARRALEERAERAGLTRRVRFHDSVPGEALRDILADADVGVVPIRAVVPNYFYSLPNKVFELMSAHRPMVAADLPEIRAVVEDNGLGLIFDPDDPRDIARAITTLLDSPEREAYARRAGAASATHNWQAERSKLLRLYAGLELPATRALRAAPQRATP